MNDYDTFKLYTKLLDWVANLPEPEKKQEGKWKPKKGETFYFPNILSVFTLFEEYYWTGNAFDRQTYERGLCCKTPEEAIALAERMLEAIKS